MATTMMKLIAILLLVPFYVSGTSCALSHLILGRTLRCGCSFSQMVDEEAKALRLRNVTELVGSRV